VRPTPNANVLIELGYAVKSLGTTDRLVLVMNTAYGDVLPFDLRQYRLTTYCLPDAASGEVREKERKDLTAKLEKTFRHALLLPSRRIGLELARCGNVYWMANNLVYAALALIQGNLAGALLEWNHGIHHAGQLPIPADLVNQLRELQRTDLSDVGQRAAAAAELRRIWTEIGRFVEKHQPDFAKRDAQQDRR
jgi:hypothetical protein